MAIPLRVLVVEDSEEDALLVTNELRRGGFDPSWERVETRETMAEALDRGPWDLILSDFGMPRFSAAEALALYRERGIETPFILVSGTVGEEQAVASLKAGAHDFFLKDHLSRLCRAVERELREAENRRARRRAEEEQQQALAALARSEEFLRQVLDQNPNFIFVKNREGRFTLANRALAEAYGTTVDGLIGKTDADFNTNAGEAEWFRRDDLEVMDTGREKVIPEEAITDAAGVRRWLQTIKRPLFGTDGRAEHVLGVATDITERKQVEESLRENARVLIESQRAARLGSYRTDLVSGTWTSSTILDEIFGIVDPAFRRDVPAWLSIVHPDERKEMADYLAEVLGKRQGFDREYRILRLGDGEERWVHGLGRLAADSEGRPVEMIGTIQDITQRKQAEAERAHVEGMLRQAQKIEALGQLAGGVAHDFNNILGVIAGYGELAQRQLGTDHPARARVDQMLKAAERAVALTRQLLAFGRKQVLQPQSLDLNATVADTHKMLGRLIGEDIEVVVRPAPGLGTVKVDPSQVVQIILNLAVNARDAMSKGGSLTLETANVELDEDYAAAHPPVIPGRYVMLAVSDTGVGMDEETQRRIFEPFFTTKPAGEGTGLGLATVYGIVKQSGGYIWVYSEPGRGTTFKVYLPQVDEPAEAPRPAVPSAAISRGHETILLVEDNEPLRDVIRETLEGNGYTVLPASNGEEALALTCAPAAGPVDLLLTDVVMPKLGGGGLTKRLAVSRPEIRVLYMSGYTNGAISQHGVLGDGVMLLEKPFTGDRLLGAVREALSGPATKDRPTD